MVLPGHLAGGYLASSAILLLSNNLLTNPEMVSLLMIGTIAGELPDIDLFLFSKEEHDQIKKHKKMSVCNHREYITHAPVFWLILCSIVVLSGYIFDNHFAQMLGQIILAGTCSHLLLDSIDDGVMWLWPYSKKRYAIFKASTETHVRIHSLKYYWKFITTQYPKYWTFYVEIFISIIAVYTIFS